MKPVLQDKKMQVICDPGSDIEEEDNNFGKVQGNLTTGFTPYPNAPSGVRLRCYRPKHLNELSFSLHDVSEISPKSTSAHVYEVIFVLWLQSWIESSKTTDSLFTGVFDLFLENINFILPLCLKSIVLRCKAFKDSIELVPSIVLDTKHMRVLEPLCEGIAQGFMKPEINRKNTKVDADISLVHALFRISVLIDFFIGLFAIIHPSQVSWLIFKFIKSLQDYEDNVLSKKYAHTSDDSIQSFWQLRRSRQIRLLVVEKLSSMPRFIALNYPLKYSAWRENHTSQPFSWTNQRKGKDEMLHDYGDTIPIFPDGIERLPETHWLAELLANECFYICSQCCEAVVNEALSHVNASEPTIRKHSSIRQRIPLTKSHLISYQSTAYHAITVAYELILRAHATDTRFQEEDSRTRIAGIFVTSVIENSVAQGVQWLAKLDPMHKVRVLWLLCVLYILQEAPESSLRVQMRSLCTPQKVSSL